ncbi:MAG TPA: hypothetical protein VHH53_08150 [Pseudonocardiaceae bacterium]|nr:hypothetical protein [Pseudonocardiaceae bacterium]
MNDTVRYQLDGHVATITYHRPERLNAIDGATTRTRGWASSPVPAGRSAQGRTYAARATRPVSSGHILGAPDGELVRERLGDLQTGHRGSQRVLPRLRVDAGHLV